MPTQIVECIPNFSEARRPEVVEAIMQAITSVPESPCSTATPTWTTTAPC